MRTDASSVALNSDSSAARHWRFRISTAEALALLARLRQNQKYSVMYPPQGGKNPNRVASDGVSFFAVKQRPNLSRA
jgi:hypothetical protein